MLAVRMCGVRAAYVTQGLHTTTAACLFPFMRSHVLTVLASYEYFMYQFKTQPHDVNGYRSRLVLPKFTEDTFTYYSRLYRPNGPTVTLRSLIRIICTVCYGSNVGNNLQENSERGLMRSAMKTFVNYRRRRLACLRDRGRIQIL